MANRLEPLNLADFRGGINLRKDQLQIQPNESPEMNNITLDVEGGIRTRFGFERFNDADIVDPDVVTWDPQRAWLHQLADGTDHVYIANSGTLLCSDLGEDFMDCAVTVAATPHLADFVTWGDDLYVAAGRTEFSLRRRGTGSVGALSAAGTGSWNDDYTAPVHDILPKAELFEAHAGYLFAAYTNEDGTDFPNRLRWSHPLGPDDWATDDFIDIGDGGNRISALMSYEDHLLIFKPDSVWALYGYDLESWQLVKKSSTCGTLSPQAVSRSEGAVFFYSPSERGAIFLYGGERPEEISQPIRPALNEMFVHENVWVGWIARKLWVTLPWSLTTGATLDSSAMFVWDPSLSEVGSWMHYSTGEGALGPLVGGSNIDTQHRPLGVLRGTETPCVVYLEAIEDLAADLIWTYAVLGGVQEEDDVYIVTGADEDIEMAGMPGYSPFDSVYRTSWINGDWPTRRKSWRRPDFVTSITGTEHQLRVESFRNYDHAQASRAGTITVATGGTGATWGEFDWGDGTLWGGTGVSLGSRVVRGSSFGLARSIQIRITGLTSGARWGINAIVTKLVMRRFR